MVSRLAGTVVAIGVLALSTATRADDVYYRVPLSMLDVGKAAPLATPRDWPYWDRALSMQPYVVLDGPGEAYVDFGDINLWYSLSERADQQMLLIRTAAKRDITGRLFYPKLDWSRMAIFKFRVPATAAGADAESFFRAKEAYYRILTARGIPGAAWFRHEARQAGLALDGKPKRPAFTTGAFGPSFNRLADTYALFTGGRAMSENLQLDRMLRETDRQEATVDIDGIEGISVPQIDWQPLVKGLKPELDPLASFIPADQHVVFFPSFSAAMQTADEADRQGTPVLFLAEPRSEDARTAQRYQRQLCLSATGVGRLLGPHLVSSVALTGSDPYFRTGTDVAVLFEATKPAVLESLLLGQVGMAAAREPSAKPQQGDIDGVHYQGVRSPDRRISSYVARIDQAVVVTNSLYQLGRLASVRNKQSAAIASLPEYVFFRDRYRRADPEETAFLFLSDATIRRWCGPRWRIASSRQARDMAVLSELTAANLDPLARRTVRPGPLQTDLATADAGKLSLDAIGVRSSVQGSLEWMTPIAEIPLRKATWAETQAYGDWRNGYQRNWRWAFDPIALRLTLDRHRLAADMTVMPLIWNSEYRFFVDLCQGVKFGPKAGDPHDAPFHTIMSIDPKSGLIGAAEHFLAGGADHVSLRWLGPSISFYVDDDPSWGELLAEAERERENPTKSGSMKSPPFAVRFDVAGGSGETALTTARRLIQQHGGPTAKSDTLSYRGQSYLKLSWTSPHDHTEPIYCAVVGNALIVTPNENVLKRAIDRQQPAAGEAASAKVAEKPWLGSNLALKINRKAIDAIARLNRHDFQRAMQARSWSNLPILNQWKRLYPDEDPVALHERIWKVRLVCPGGGRYIWNERWQTMESTVYGHPGEPKLGPPAPPIFQEFISGSFGVTFEHQGLRSRASLERAGMTTDTHQQSKHP